MYQEDIVLLELYNSIKIEPKKGRGEIYHYTSPEGLFGIIKERCLFATDMLYQNDANEGVYSLDLLRRVVNTNEEISPLLKEQIEIEIGSLKDKAADHYKSYIICFCKNSDLLNMWKYYTKGSSVKGYNMGFDISKLEKSLHIMIDDSDSYNTTPALPDNADRLKVIHGSINYNEKDQLFQITDIVNKFVRKLTANAKGNVRFLSTMAYLIVKKVYYMGVFFKTPPFSEEREYRFLFMPGAVVNDPELQKKGIPAKEEFRLKDGILVPYQKCRFDTDCARSITGAPSMDLKRGMASLNRMLKTDFPHLQGKIKESSIKLRY